MLAASDRAFKRFGAAHHRYVLAPPIDITTLDLELPQDVRELASRVGSGGAGPYYGWIPVECAARCLIEAPREVDSWRRALPVAHLGCGYAAVVPLDGTARGEVWLDARAIQMVVPIRPNFTTLYLEWIDRLAHAVLPDGFVAPGRCPLAIALSGYLALAEQRRGLPAGTLNGPELRELLGALGPGAIEIAADSSLALFGPGDRVDPCIVCARLLDTLAADGLARDVVAPGLPPIPLRTQPTGEEGPRAAGR